MVFTDTEYPVTESVLQLQAMRRASAAVPSSVALEKDEDLSPFNKRLCPATER
jgi:hypothetical protein